MPQTTKHEIRMPKSKTISNIEFRRLETKMGTMSAYSGQEEAYLAVSGAQSIFVAPRTVPVA